MSISNYLLDTPWDTKVFGLKTYEIIYDSQENLKKTIQEIQLNQQVGHYTVKISPLFPKQYLHEAGFYYCDTLIEPFCSSHRLAIFEHQDIALSASISLNDLQKMCHQTFTYDRFHRDFNIPQHLADLRYISWLTQLYEQGSVWGLMYKDELAGFWGFSEHKILLHALGEQYRGQGLSKYFWSVACQKLFDQGYSEITSSISSANLAVLNLYISLGFKFKNPQDIYHLMIG